MVTDDKNAGSEILTLSKANDLQFLIRITGEEVITRGIMAQTRFM